MPSKFHARLQKKLMLQLELNYSKRLEALPEITVKMPKDVADGKRDRVPDIGIYPADLSFMEDEIRMTEMPLAVVEILSPQQELSELIARKNVYFRAGVRSYWLVLPELLSIYVYHAPNDFEIYTKNETLRDPNLGIELDLGPVFEGIFEHKNND